MQSEAACLEALTQFLPNDQRPFIHCAGPGPDRAAIACREIEMQNVSGVASIGVAGGLDSALDAGTLVLPAAVITSDNQLFETDSRWRRNIVKQLPIKPPATLHMGMDIAVTDPKDKVRLFKEYKTHAVDMESHVIAAYASQRSVPFVILRSVADTADKSIPDAALAGLDEKGNVVPLQVLRQLAPNPKQLPALMRLARDSNAAMKSLKAIPKAALTALCRIEVPN